MYASSVAFFRFIIDGTPERCGYWFNWGDWRIGDIFFLSIQTRLHDPIRYVYASWENIVRLSAYHIRFRPFTVVEIYRSEIAPTNRSFEIVLFNVCDNAADVNTS